METSSSLPTPVVRPFFFVNAPLIAVVISFAVGIIIPRVLSTSAFSYWSLLAMAVFFAGAALILHRVGRSNLAIILIFPFFLVIGMLRSPQSGIPADPFHISQIFQEQKEVVLLGILQEPPVYRERETSLLLEVKELWTPEIRKVCWGRVRLTVAGNASISFLAPGDTTLARAKLSMPQKAGTPGAFDYRAFLAQQSIWVIGRVPSAAHLMRLESSTSGDWVHILRYLPERARQRIGSFLDLHLPEQIRGLYRAIIIGDLSGMPEPLLEQFRSTGTMHLLAISGMNIGLITFVINLVAWWLLSRSQWVLLHLPAQKITLCLAIPFMLLYAFVAGFQAPVVRALIMVLVFVWATLLDRQWQVANNIAIAALLILAFSPGDLFTVSFQLSFAAVIAISQLIEPLRRLMFEGAPKEAATRNLVIKLRDWLVAGLFASLAASAGTLPFMLYHFNRFSLLSPISTLLVEPFLCFWAQMPGLPACLLIPAFPQAAEALLTFGGLGVQVSVWLVEQLARIPAREIWLPTPGVLAITTWYVLLFCVFMWQRSLFARITGFLAIVILAIIPVVESWQRQHDTELRVHFLDVGQGSATLVEFPGGRTILIDAGGHETGRFNVGEDIVAPFLWKKGITRLDSIVVTHPHADHINGLPFLVERFRPVMVWVNGDKETSSGMAALFASAKMAKSQIIPVTDSKVLFSTNAGSLRCLGHFGVSAGQHPSPIDESEAARETDFNRSSLVFRLESAGLSFLFPGDIGTEEEKILLEQESDIKVDVLLAPHHGSRSSNSESFVRASSARFVVISSGGRKNVFPAEEVLERYEDLGAQIFETRRDGAITFKFERDRLSIETFRKSVNAKDGEM